MPDFYAHEVFGAKVFAALPKPVQDRLEPEKDAWQCGLYGPDPLFFYHPLWPNRPCHEGHILHRQPPAVVLARYHTQTAMATPYAAAYAAGYYCHYALDAACHPLVNQSSRGNALRHTIIEGAFDRALRQSGAGHERAPLELPTDSAVYAAAAMGYQYAQPDQYRAALKRFLQASRMLAGLRNNTPAREKYRATALELQKRMERAVQPCARMVAQLVESMEQGGSAHYLPRANFAGVEHHTGSPLPAAEPSK